MSRTRCLVAATALLAASPACASRQHLWLAHGRSYTTTFAGQVVAKAPRTKPPEAPTLDASEASVIAGSYRKSLAPKPPARDETASVMLVQPAPP